MQIEDRATPVSHVNAGRRAFIQAGLIAAAGLALPVSALAKVGEAMWPEKHISLFNTHTGERLKRAVFWTPDGYVHETLRDIDYLLRDHRADETHPIDPALLDLLHNLSRKVGGSRPFHIISGFRSPVTNNRLRQQSGGVAKRSLHMDGKAIDIRFPGGDLHALHRAAKSLKAGGVGLYRDSNFVHVDTGRVRYW